MTDKFLELDGLTYYTGKVKAITNDLSNRINNLSSLGRYLSTWRAETGLAGTNAPYSPYPYKTGDFMLVASVAAEGGTNYRPSGTQYVNGQASTTVETEEVKPGDIYLYDNSVWTLMQGGSAGAITDVKVNGTSVVTDYVANIPIANSNTIGVVRGSGSNGYGFQVLGGGYAATVLASDEDISAKVQNYKPIVPANLDKAVMEGLGNNSLTWSEQYKTNARNTIGAGTQSTIKYWS